MLYGERKNKNRVGEERGGAERTCSREETMTTAPWRLKRCWETPKSMPWGRPSRSPPCSVISGSLPSLSRSRVTEVDTPSKGFILHPPASSESSCTTTRPTRGASSSASYHGLRLKSIIPKRDGTRVRGMAARHWLPRDPRRPRRLRRPLSYLIFPLPDPPLRPRTSAPAAESSGLAARAFSSIRTFTSLFTLNPFAKLTPEDLSGGTPSWTLEFIGGAGSYSWPAGSAQSRMRVQENVRRYARNYALLSVIVFACTLYKMPVSLLGLIACLVLWEFGRFCGDKWQLEERSPGIRQAFIHIAQLGE
ncbi:hypothetical protein GW17_00013369 [Ensete ventricosum]|nr:hypothetical protein GW17_00013369 [Ensete ventricosum]